MASEVLGRGASEFVDKRVQGQVTDRQPIQRLSGQTGSSHSNLTRGPVWTRTLFYINLESTICAIAQPLNYRPAIIGPPFLCVLRFLPFFVFPFYLFNRKKIMKKERKKRKVLSS
jgi:hypothetical protein